uniref:Uncharacterized protein n=1 Tax=Pipistrellus kuhlii TaxID=59472 RepID=A0A7J7RZV5_PIPKU|nr:hypothetical protein mPipKuh1_010213 [Pipistrellus kuhlii]
MVSCLFIKGEVERPLQRRDCAGRVPLTLGHFIHRNFQAGGLFWVLVCIFVRFGFGKISIFTVHGIGQRKRNPGAAADGPPPLLGFPFLRLRGNGFRGEGWSTWRKEVFLLGTEEPGVPSHFLQSALSICLARRACPQTTGPHTLPPSFQAPGRKTTKERKKIYIYINIYII